ncbi:hypothetical protein SAMN05421771_0948 [Granulicella pectinivorans]|jgi:hypothetical protein|uniref:Muconolactone delta-isomerase n=1 Tax=Granulicella pectinivorans TaxID=474950 RepID=A0A1I6LMA6_9BACT|nr:hypothetical protein SAMN05421771_0948 [Granulicella pectinivorans]
MKRLLLVLLSFAFLSAGLHAQGPVKTTRILAILTIKPGVQRSEFAKLMPDEVKATVRLYLEGKISEWYARGDGKGVVFLMDCATVDEAKALTAELPLDKAGYAEFTFMPLGPLTPLHWLLGDAPGQAAAK